MTGSQAMAVSVASKPREVLPARVGATASVLAPPSLAIQRDSGRGRRCRHEWCRVVA